MFSLPRLIVDKSALQMLSGELIEELTLWLSIVVTPTLLRELVGNLSKHHTPKKGKLPPETVLRSLAGKLQRNSAAIPVSFKKLALNELLGSAVEMNGFTIPVDVTAGNVHSGNKMLMVDGTMQQNLFSRWAVGDHSTVDKFMAGAWREGVDQIDFSKISGHAKRFVAGYASNAKNVADVIAAVNSTFADPEQKTQIHLLAVLLVFLRAEPEYGMLFGALNIAQPKTLLQDFAPYAASVLRLYIVFASCVRLGFIRRDANSVADLQYLTYTPFATGFVSNDDLHRRLFPATLGTAVFVSSDILSADLQRRLEWRKSLSPDEWAAHRRLYGIYPKEFPGSPINEIWDRTAIPRKEPPQPTAVDPQAVKSINDDPRLHAMVDAMNQLQEESAARKSPESTAWPFGAKPEDTTPL